MEAQASSVIDIVDDNSDDNECISITSNGTTPTHPKRSARRVSRKGKNKMRRVESPMRAGAAYTTLRGRGHGGDTHGTGACAAVQRTPNVIDLTKESPSHQRGPNARSKRKRARANDGSNTIQRSESDDFALAFRLQQEEAHGVSGRATHGGGGSSAAHDVDADAEYARRLHEEERQHALREAVERTRALAQQSMRTTYAHARRNRRPHMNEQWGPDDWMVDDDDDDDDDYDGVGSHVGAGIGGLLQNLWSRFGHVSPMQAGPARGDDDNTMSYEEMLALDDRIPKKGLSPASVRQKTMEQTLTKEDAARMKEKKEECVICLDEYKARQKIRRLPCLCTFHAKCIDRHLKTSPTCPLCRAKI